MIFRGKQLLSIATVLFLVVLTFTTGDDGSNTKLKHSTGDAFNNTQKGDTRNSSGAKNGSDYQWSSNDDYVNDGSIDDDDDDEEVSSPVPGNETETSISPTNLHSNDTDLDAGGQNLGNNTASSESVSTLPQAGSSSTEANENEPPQTSPNEINTTSVASSSSTPTSDDESSNTSTTEDGNNTSTEKVPPSHMITQDLGDESDYTSTLGPDRSIDPAGLKTWAVVVVSVLISFAVIFTILYFIRGELIRRRKADQRRLLRGSISSEGYFYGDGEGNTGGKFEL